jgi:alpha-glucosidase
MLAMYIVLESYLTSICDYPDAYKEQEGFDLLTTIPTTWDETKVLDAKVGGYIITARRKNNDWYIGGINSSQARTLTIPMQFLGEGSFDALIYTDAPDAVDYPNHLNKEIKTIRSTDIITIPLAGSGGVVIRLTKKD